MKCGPVLMIGLLLSLAIALSTYADQVIYVDVGTYDASMSQFGQEVKGNTWVETTEEGAIGGTAFGAPGDNNHSNDGGEPYLVIKLPVQVKAGESTDDGKTWEAWARLLEPQALVTKDDYNSFFLRLSADAETWTPGTRGSSDLRWNDPGAMFPDSINGDTVLLTDVGEDLPWFWQTAAMTSSVDPILAAGENYIELGPRESDVANYPRIDVVCLRNDGGQPSDGEALDLLPSGTAVQPIGKLTTRWADMKSMR